MAGGMSRGTGRALGDRLEAAAAAPRALRHCWVVHPPEADGRWPGVLLEWRRVNKRWEGRVAYGVGDGGASVLVERWLDAAHLESAAGG